MKAFRALLAALLFSCIGAHADGPFPNRTIKIVVANPPGGQTDVATRIIG